MKYEYDGKEKKDIVENYEENNNKIVINYLDGSTQTIQLTKENLEHIKGILLKQAEERRNTDGEKILADGLLYRGAQLGVSVMGLVTSILFSASTQFSAERIFFAGVSAICAINIIFTGQKICIEQKEIDDIRKYNIYLNNKEDFDEYKDRLELYENVEYKKPIDINTIDEYSYEDLEQMRDNIKGIKSYENFCAVANEKFIKS